DEDGLRKFRKRIPLGRNFEALEFARSLGIDVAINIIADPDWDEERFRVVRDWCMDVPEVVNISSNTPYPGTETWLTEPPRPETNAPAAKASQLYIHAHRGRAGRSIDDSTESFVEATRMGASS